VLRLGRGKRVCSQRAKVRADAFLDPLCRRFFMNYRHIVASALVFALASALAMSLAAPVLLLRASQGSGDAVDRPMIEMVSDPTLGWQRNVLSRTDCVNVAGGHATVLQQPHVEEVARAMQRHLDRMGSRGAQPITA
jgi:thioesterase domain-containing protein